MTVQPSVVETLGYSAETALGTPDTYTEIRYTDFAAPWQTRMLADNPTNGHAHPYDTADSRPVAFEKCREGAVSFSTEVRRSSTTDTAPPLAAMFASAGCGVLTNSKTTVDGYTSAIAFSLAAAGAGAGQAMLVELSNGQYWPTLVASNSGAATYNVVPVVALPSATESAKAIEVMSTIYPRLRQVPATATLSFLRSTLADYTGGTNQIALAYNGCALAKGPAIAIQPSGQTVKVPLSFHAAKIVSSDTKLSAETFVDSERFVVTDDNLRCDFVTFSASGGIAASALAIYGATLDTGFTTVPIYAGGSQATVGGIQGYMHVPGVPMLTLQADLDISYLDALESAQTLHEIAIVQPTTSLATPAMGIWCHNAHLVGDDAVTVDYRGKSFATVTLKYRLGSAMLGADEEIDSAAAAPWHIAISGQGGEA